MSIKDLVKGSKIANNVFCRNLVVCICTFMLAFVFCSGITQPVLEGALLQAPDKSIKIELKPDQELVKVGFDGWYLVDNEITPSLMNHAIKDSAKFLGDTPSNWNVHMAQGLRKLYEVINSHGIEITLNHLVGEFNHKHSGFTKSYPVGTHKEKYAYTKDDLKLVKQIMLSEIKRRIDKLKK
ncbi:MAG: hypothetical protein SCARUB_00882 [Candidatus Scalindua rubra]|uniref:Uncharacterized protein n=1 Tax=Candidatus Scalindua rubra TaxID=1872076 RepID=A0A1E3XEE5_9BACT|nr:MAG: hypothetical protein SCARUB_00882 [Candidatus Scalindua rubra]